MIVARSRKGSSLLKFRFTIIIAAYNTGAYLDETVAMLQLNACIDRGKKEYLQQRVVNGIRAAKAKGVKVGRRPKERPAEFKHLKEWKRGEVSSRDAAKTLGVSRATFLRWVRDEGSV